MNLVHIARLLTQNLSKIMGVIEEEGVASPVQSFYKYMYIWRRENGKVFKLGTGIFVIVLDTEHKHRCFFDAMYLIQASMLYQYFDKYIYVF